MIYEIKNFIKDKFKGLRYSLTSYLLPLTSILLIASCEKDIDIDYHDADMKYVVEGAVSNSGTKVRVSRTKPMDDNTTDSDISNATVVVTADDGTTETIPYTSNGLYISRLKGVPGVTYRLDVSIDGQHFTSTSTMQKMPVMNEFRLVRKEMFSNNYIFGDIRLQDIPNEVNYYFVHIYRNGLSYRWAAIKDESNPNKELQQLFGFFREGADDKDVLRDGDRLKILVRAIDKGAYDYLSSMESMDQTGTNPIDNFTGGCLGYFSAHSEEFHEMNFYYSLIEDDDE